MITKTYMIPEENIENLEKKLTLRLERFARLIPNLNRR